MVVTDGRATGDGDALAQARRAAAALACAGTSSIVVDAEDGPVRLGLAGDLARHLKAELVTVPDLASPLGARRELAGQRLADIIRAKEVA